MTCIVAIVEENKTYMAADTEGFDSYGRKTDRKDKKLFIGQTSSNQNFMIGFTSSYRMGQILRYQFNPPGYDEHCSDDDLFKYMVTIFVNEIRATFKTNGYGSIKDGESSHGGTFIVAIKNKLYEIQEDFQVAERVTNYSACGSGYDYALASLYTSYRYGEDSPENRITIALQSAMELSNTVGGRIEYLQLQH